MNTKLVVTWVAVLALGSVAWVAFTRDSPFEFLGLWLVSYAGYLS